MLKLIFWALLGINAVLYASSHGMLGSYKSGEREPQRLRNQFNTDKLVLQLPAGAARGAAAVPAAAPSTAPASAPPAAPATTPAAPAATPSAALVTAPAAAVAACTEVGNFNAAQARRFDTLVKPLALADRQTRIDITIPEITSYMVMIPPLGSKEAADRKSAELKAQGVTNFFTLNDSTPTKWAISLGVFKAESAAQTMLAQLKKQGVTGAKVAGRTSQAQRQVYRFRDLDAAGRAALAEVVGKFDDITTRACKL